MLTAEYSSRLAFTEATDWLVFEGGMWSESAPAAQGIAQELTDRQLAEAGHLLEKARDELMVTGADAVLAAASSKAKSLVHLNVMSAQFAGIRTIAKEYPKDSSYILFLLNTPKRKCVVKNGCTK
ncbi:hypothetical protein [Corynebacterium amycolatum]|uniref:hypothetical protein n=1 Tax=Corynebacterium amycolatum TaxID=43765 RepID=UPI001F2C93C5|nr:hypothetical protein [Corynebacterium amycolatum]